jgi:hypothetical protein
MWRHSLVAIIAVSEERISLIFWVDERAKQVTNKEQTPEAGDYSSSETSMDFTALWRHSQKIVLIETAMKTSYPRI